MSTALDAIKSARAYLNDNNGITWSDHALLPFLQEAFGELQLNLGSFRIPVIKSQIEVVIPSGTTVFPSLPVNITSPISLFEKNVTASDDFYMEMSQVTFLPSQIPQSELAFWSWRAQQIEFIGATQDRKVKFRFNGYLTAPMVLTDPLGFIFAERFLGPRIASLALSSVGQAKRSISAEESAQKNLYQIMQYNTTQDQRPVKRRKYRSLGRASLGGTSVPVGNISETSSMPIWIAATNQPDGVTTVFTFANDILYLALDGTMLFPSREFIQVGIRQYSITDNSGNVLVPASGSVLMGQIS